VINTKIQLVVKNVKNTIFFHKIKLFVFLRKIEIVNNSKKKKLVSVLFVNQDSY